MRYDSIASSFLSENIISITVKFTWMIHTYFVIMRSFSSLPHVQRTFATSE
jgi:hypothetical protein